MGALSIPPYYRSVLALQIANALTPKKAGGVLARPVYSTTIPIFEDIYPTAVRGRYPVKIIKRLEASWVLASFALPVEGRFVLDGMRNFQPPILLCCLSPEE